jgi:hypothetical protein
MMTLQEMYQDLRARGHLGDGQPPRRAERAVLWPWAVTSLNTTLVESAASEEKPREQNADLERHT